ncbi:MAG TPA: PHP domain-containing protein [Tepidisphaeraceae bacterium]|jgi:error-prone DNA polymerase
MPESPQDKIRLVPEPPPEQFQPSLTPYVELDVTTNFTFLTGASHADELVLQAARSGHRAIAVTDTNTLAGVVRMFDAVRQISETGTGWAPKLIIGSRLVFDDAPDLLVWAPDRQAYARLCRLLTIGRRRAPKGECLLHLSDFLEHSEGLLAGVVPSKPFVKTARVMRHLTDALGRERLSVIISRVYGADDQTRMRNIAGLAKRFNIPLLATNAVHYHEPNRRALQDVLTCVKHKCSIQQAGFKLWPNAERYLKSPEQMHRLFADYPGAIHRGLEIADRCTFSLDELRYEYPDEIVPAGKTPIQYLTDITWQGAHERYPDGIPDRVRGLVNHELALIQKLNFEAYFLTVYDIMKFARSRDILCQGRGSAANSAVCYCIGVTSVNPDKFDLLFERFVSAARNEPPDIDVDFEHERREEVIQYIYEKYGRERAGMTATVITYRGRSAVRDVGKALGLGLDVVDQLAKRLDWWHRGTLSESQLRESGIDPNDSTVTRLVHLTAQLLGFPRHLSQHTGGMVMTRGPLCEMVPIENASMEDRTVIEWDKDDIDAVGILKVDVLALGMLTALSKGLKFINQRHEGTEARRHEVRGEGKEASGEDSNVSGSGGMAENNAVGSTCLPSHYEDAGDRTIWPNKPDETCCGVDSFQHRRRLCKTNDCGLHQVPSLGAGINGGTLHTSRDCNQLKDAPSIPAPNGSPGGIRSNSSGSHPEPGGEAAKAQTSTLTKQLLAPCSPSSLPSCLRASVPSCLELHTLPSEDPLVYDMCSDADTVGVFQIESRAQMSMLPRLRPERFYDLVIEVAIVRPGPIQGNMVHPYLQRRELLRQGRADEITFESDELKDVLSHTLGVPLFQEQAMRVVMVAAGFTADEADKLRRAMAAWRRNGVIDTFYPKIINGMLDNGYTRDFAERVFEQIRGFGEYGFPESHAASFALLVYASAWIKRHHPAAFCAALLNSQPMGFYAPAQIIRDAKEHGVTILPVDINHSDWDCTLEERHAGTKAHRHEGREQATEKSDQRAPTIPSSLSPSPLTPCLRASVPSCLSTNKSLWGKSGPAVRLGLRRIKGLKAAHADLLTTVRKRIGPFTSIPHLHHSTGISTSTLRLLAEADAFSSLGLTRRQALWQVMELSDENFPLFPDPSDTPSCLSASVPSCLPQMPLGQEVMTDYCTLGHSLKSHPLALVRAELDARKITPAKKVYEMSEGWVKVAGLVLIRQRPGTASGIVFETLEDETGIVNLIVKPDIYERFRPAARHAGLLQADGYLQRQGNVVHIIAKRLFDLSHLLAGYQFSSRDFH